MGPLGRVRLSALMERSVEGGIDQWLSRSTIGAVDRGTWQSELMGVFPAGPMYLGRWPKTLKTALMASLEGTGNQYGEDVAAEGGIPFTVRLTKLNETAIRLGGLFCFWQIGRASCR